MHKTVKTCHARKLRMVDKNALNLVKLVYEWTMKLMKTKKSIHVLREMQGNLVEIVLRVKVSSVQLCAAELRAWRNSRKLTEKMVKSEQK